MKMNQVIDTVIILSAIILVITVGIEIYGGGKTSNFRLTYLCSGVTTASVLCYLLLVRARRLRNKSTIKGIIEEKMSSFKEPFK